MDQRDRWEQFRQQAEASAHDTELRSVENAQREERGVVCLAVGRGAESSGQPRTPLKRPWFVGFFFLLFGLLFLVVGLMNPAPITEAGSKQVLVTLPFNPLFALFGLLAAGGGYCFLCGVSRLLVDPAGRRWTRERGVAPFVRTSRGSLDQTNCWAIATATRTGRKGRPYEVWALRLVGVGTEPSGFLELPAFDLRREYVERDAALQVYKNVAERTGIPLDEIVPSLSTMAEPTVAVESDLSDQALRLPPRRYSDSRITVSAAAAAPEDGVVLTLDRPGESPRLAARFVGALIPLALLAFVVHSANESHQQFLQRVPPASRAVFEAADRRSAPFEIAAVGFFGALSLLPVAFFVATTRLYAANRRRIALGPDDLVVTDLRGGRETERLRIPLSDLDTVRASATVREMVTTRFSVTGGFGYSETPAGASLSVFGAKIPLGPVSTGLSVVVSGPRRADASLGGDFLRSADFAFLQEAARAWIEPAGRGEGRDRAWLFAPPLAAREPDTETEAAAVAEGAQKRLQHRLGLACAAVAGLSLLNSCTLNLAFQEAWTGVNDGTRFRHWTNGWNEAWYALRPDGNLSTQVRRSSPWSSFAATSGTEITGDTGPRSGYRWRIGAARSLTQDAAPKVMAPPLTDADAAKLNAAQLNAVADRFQSAGNWPAAEDAFTRAGRAANATHDRKAAIYAYTSLATCCMAEEKPAPTVDALKKALAVPGGSPKEQASLRALLSRVENGTGTLHERVLGKIPGNRFPGETVGYVAGR